MNQGKYVYSQLMDFVPRYLFNKCVDRYKGNYRSRDFKCWQQFLCLAFGQLTHRESLRDIVICLNAQGKSLYHLGFKKQVKRSTLSDANQSRDWRIYADFASVLMEEAWIAFKPGAFYIMDRGYFDLKQLFRIDQQKAFFVIRAKEYLNLTPIEPKNTARHKYILIDQVVQFKNHYSKKAYPQRLRYIQSKSPDTGKVIVLLTNHMEINASIVAELYRQRWRIELFFKWIKQHLKIKVFWGQSENAVKTQLWIALSAYLIVAIARKRLKIKQSLYEILQILSISLLDKIPVNQLFNENKFQMSKNQIYNQLNMFDL